MGDFIERTDLAPFATIAEAKADAMIEDAEAMAVEVAPCITDDAFAKKPAVKAVLRAAILRWNDAGSGAKVTQAALGYSQTIDTSSPRKGLFWPSEIEQLQKVCAAEGGGKAFSVDTLGTGMVMHADICSINFGATYCSCGAILTQMWPLYEQ